MIGALLITARIAAALGFLSITLTNEISSLWLSAAWMAWLLSAVLDRRPDFQRELRKTETIAVFAMVALLFADFFLFRNTLFIAITHFLMFFQIVKLAGEKTRKDCLQIFLFSFFQILAACTLSVDAWHALVLLAYIPTASLALYWNQLAAEQERYASSDSPRVYSRWKKMAAWISISSFPLNLILTVLVFVLFPRLTINATLPGFSNQHTGYTDQVNLAQTGDIKQDEAVAMWLSFPKEEDRNRWNGYLRGDALSVFDGQRWSVRLSDYRRQMTPDSNGVYFVRLHTANVPVLRAAITQIDTSASTLFATGQVFRALAPIPVLHEDEEGSIHWPRPWNRPLRYEVISDQVVTSKVLPGHLSVPPISLDRIRPLCRQWAGTGTALRRAQNIERHLRDEYRYMPTFGENLTTNPVETFLFDSKRGACGHFASAMALMLRLEKIPSRLVAGYYKGDWNEPAHSYVIRKRHAHAWVEGFIPGKGWVAFDPTPTPLSGYAGRSGSFLRILQYWDYLTYQWNRVIIQYDLYAQLRALQKMSQTLPSVKVRFLDYRRSSESLSLKERIARLPNWKEMGLFILLSGTVFLLFSKRRSRRKLEAAVRPYARFLERMARAGVSKEPQETGLEFADRIAREKPAYDSEARQRTAEYYAVRFRS